MSPKETADETICRILEDCYEKYRDGEKKHGMLDIRRDPRNFLKESIFELRDAIVYFGFEIARLEGLLAYIDRMTQKGFIMIPRAAIPNAEAVAREIDAEEAMERRKKPQKVLVVGAPKIHESALLAFHIVEEVKHLLAGGTPPKIVLELIDEMEGRPGPHEIKIGPIELVDAPALSRAIKGMSKRGEEPTV